MVTHENKQLPARRKHASRAADGSSARRLRSSPGLAVAALTIGLMGCAADGDTSSDAHAEPSAAEPRGVEIQDEAALNLVAELDLGAGRTIKYFEPEPGTVMELESGPIAADREPEPEQDIATRYERLSGEKPPSSLLAALDRVAEKRAQLVSSERPPDAQDGAPITWAEPATIEKQVLPAQASASWFQSAYCTAQDRFWGGPHWTGNSSITVECEYFKTGIYTHQGSVFGEVTCTGKGLRRGAWAASYVNAGWYLGVRCDTTLDKPHYSAVTQADGDVYQHCVNYHY